MKLSTSAISVDPDKCVPEGQNINWPCLLDTDMPDARKQTIDAVIAECNEQNGLVGKQAITHELIMQMFRGIDLPLNDKDFVESIRVLSDNLNSLGHSVLSTFSPSHENQNSLDLDGAIRIVWERVERTCKIVLDGLNKSNSELLHGEGGCFMD